MARKFLNGIDLANQKITSLADPTSNTDAATKQYVDAGIRGLSWKAEADAASTTNVTLSAPGATMDGVTLTSGMRVLLKNQTTGSENGIYVWTGSGSTLTRANDADTAAKLLGATVTVTQGTTNGDKVFTQTADGITLGTTSLVWSQVGGGTTYTGGNGISVAGSVITAVAASGGGLQVVAGGIQIDTSVVTRKVAANVGNGSSTSIAVVHNLGTRDVEVQVYDNTTFETVECDVVRTDANTVTLTFATAPASNSLRAVVQG